MKITFVVSRLWMAPFVALLMGCEDSTGPKAQVGGTRIHPMISAFVGDWIDLNEHFGRQISSTSLGAETALELRIDAQGHHEVRCVAVKRYAYVGVTFDGSPIFLEAVDCQPRLFWIQPKLGSRFNFAEQFRNLQPPRAVRGLQEQTNKLTIFRVYFNVLPGEALLQNGDFEIECREAGNAVLHVDFEPDSGPSSEYYTIVCLPEHEQGSGS